MNAVLSYHGPGAAVLRDSLSPEAGREIPRSEIEIEGTVNELSIRIRAEDPGALRAALNSYLRWMQVANEAREAATR